MPDCLKPPKAMPKSVRKLLCPTVPERSYAGDWRDRSTSAVNTEAFKPQWCRWRSDGLLLVIGGDDAQHRAEDLLPGDGRGVVDVGEHGRLDVVAAFEVLGTPAAGDQLGALVHALSDEALDPVALAREIASGPICVSGSNGSPTFTWENMPASRSTNSS